MSKQKTAIEFLVAELIKYRFIAEGGQFSSAIIEKAKELEKQQMANFANDYADQVMAGMNKRAEQHYINTYEQ